jgi:acetylornithine deacetylase/succinyl-diaminopimelate desuccinylase-like protein
MVRGENLYGRGAADDKGQLFAHVKALECYLRTAGELPVNVRCLFEGEEEIEREISSTKFFQRYSHFDFLFARDGENIISAHRGEHGRV